MCDNHNYDNKGMCTHYIILTVKLVCIFCVWLSAAHYSHHQSDRFTRPETELGQQNNTTEVNTPQVTLIYKQVNLLLCHSQLRLIFFKLCQSTFCCCVGQVACKSEMRLFSIFKKIEVVFHFQQTCWVKIMLHIEDHLPRLS